MDFGVICALLLLNAAVGFIQEYQAGSIVDELKKTLALKAVVLRNGRLYEVEAPEIVPGDILQVEEVRNAFQRKSSEDILNCQGHYRPRGWSNCYRGCIPSSRSVRDNR